MIDNNLPGIPSTPADNPAQKEIKQEEQKPSPWEVDREKYSAARSELRNLSYAFFVILGFFSAITGWFIALKPSIDVNRPFLGFVIGIVFLLLLMVLAKQSRIAADNLAFVKKIERAYKTKSKFKPTGIEGAANFISYVILSGGTSYFLLYPQKAVLDFHKPFDFGIFVGIALTILFATYFILGDGEYFKYLLRKNKLGRKLVNWTNRKTKTLQVWCYWTTFTALAVYWYLSWF